jgi:hypothetical protein
MSYSRFQQKKLNFKVIILIQKKLIKIPRGKFNNVRFDIDAHKNGWGIDCI